MVFESIVTSRFSKKLHDLAYKNIAMLLEESIPPFYKRYLGHQGRSNHDGI